MLYIVSTPIGNLKDITHRALETLQSCDLIACEDTRKSRILLNHYQIKKPLTSYFEYNRLQRGDHLLDLLKQGKNIALISEAGTPGISDPGYHLINLAIKNEIPITVIPGPAALIAALVLSGFSTDRFIFEGFLPKKDGPKKKRLAQLLSIGCTSIIYESPYRLLKLLKNILDLAADREVACVREITKKFEEIKRDRAEALIKYFSQKAPRGEFVVIIGPGIPKEISLDNKQA